MPSETVYGTKNPIDVRVAWGQDCDSVQVASLHKDGGRVIVDVVNGWLEAAGRPTIDWDELVKQVREAGHGDITFDGMHASLDDRRQLNDLIRVLKRSRDHAFGRDE